MFELSLILLCALVARWYFGPPPPQPRRWNQANLNPAIDEWNAQQMEEESESFYE